MEPQLEPQDWITIFSVSATVIISIVTIILNRRREKDQQQWDYKLKKEQEEREATLRKEQQKREDALLRRDRQRDERLRKIERVHTPHIEFNIECNSYGPEGDEYILEVLLIVQNKGFVEQLFKSMTIRIRGIAEDKRLSFRPNRDGHLEFPIKLVDNVEIVPDRLSGYYIERGVEWKIPYITKIPTSIKYILISALLEYEDSTQHPTERMFRISVNEDK